MTIWKRAAVGAATLALTLAAGAAEAGTLVVTADRMVDVEGGRSVAKPVVVITDGRIVSVGDRAPADLPTDAERLDLPGLTLLPGLIDMHVHLAGPPYVARFEVMRFADHVEPILQVPHAQATLEAGFTRRRR